MSLPGDTDYFTDDVCVIIQADAGPDQTLECTGLNTMVTLDGSASTGSPIQYTWRENGNIIAGPSGTPTASANFNVGLHVIELTVEGINGLTGTDTDIVVITVKDTTPPSITLLGPNPVTLECAVDTYVEPGYNVDDLCDPNPQVVVTDNINEGVPGSYEVIYRATDASGNVGQEIRDVDVEDTIAPTFTLVSTDPLVLWPPNHKYKSLTVSGLVASVSDLCDATLTVNDVKFDSVSSDEPDDSTGDGATDSDVVITRGCSEALVRSERLGNGNGRVYTAELHLEDASGNVGSSIEYQVQVPKSKKAVATDDGPDYTVQCV